MIKTWSVSCPGNHTVSLDHGFWSGRAAIIIDGQEVYRRGFTVFDTGFEHRFRIDDMPCLIRVLNRPFAFTHELWVDGRLQ